MTRPPAQPVLDVAQVEQVLRHAAKARRTVSYGEALRLLDRSFSRALVRQLCRVLGEVDDRALARGQPELAVLVVRKADGMPGEGYFATARRHGELDAPRDHPQVRAIVEQRQAEAFRYWANRDPDQAPTRLADR